MSTLPDLVERFIQCWSSTSSGTHVGFDSDATTTKFLDLAKNALRQLHQGYARGDREDLLRYSDILVDYAHQKLHAYPFRDVPAHWRELYTDSAILHSFGLAWQDDVQDIGDRVKSMRLAIRTCDQAVVMAGAAGLGRKELCQSLIHHFEALISDASVPSAFTLSQQEESGPKKRRKLNATLDDAQLPRVQFGINRWKLPTMEEFSNHIRGPHPTPIIITNAMDYWPALTRWADLDRLCEAAGPDRLVPVEIGSQYTDENWTQRMMPFKEFVDEFITCDASPMTASTRPLGYLAQHDLFEQIPRLRQDIDIPDYCLVCPPDQIGYSPPEDVLLNAWFGPKGTISPMHTDPYHNLLAQVVGSKYVRLYAPSQSRLLYPFGASGGGGGEGNVETMLGNTSQVAVEAPNLEQFPLFAQAEYVEAILAPGELLYIPFQWWHYIRSLSVSFSASFWF